MGFWAFVFLVGIRVTFGVSEAASVAPPNTCWIKPLVANPSKAFQPDVLLRAASAEDVPDLLGPLKDHWTLAFESQSPQTADYRVVAYAPEALTVVAYTGCANDYPTESYPICEQIEVARLKYPAEKIELSAYRLPGKGYNVRQFPVHQVVPNAEQCISCHGSNPNTRFEPYNSWPGFFGSRSRDGEDIMRKGSPEHATYVAFVNKIFSDPENYRKYTRLTWRLADSLRPQEIKKENLSYHVDKGEIPIRIQHSGSTQPNAELNKMLSEWRGRMIVKRLVESGRFALVKHALLSTALGCYNLKPPSPLNDITSYLPDTVPKPSFDKFASDIEEIVLRERLYATQRVRRDNPFDDDGRYRLVGAFPNGDRTKSELLRLAYLWKAVGLSFDNWSGAGDQKFNFNEGESAVGYVFRTLKEYLDACDHALKPYVGFLQFERFTGVVPVEQISTAERARLCQSLADQGRRAAL